MDWADGIDDSLFDEPPQRLTTDEPAQPVEPPAPEPEERTTEPRLTR